jgi:hypothetical protein
MPRVQNLGNRRRWLVRYKFLPLYSLGESPCTYTLRGCMEPSQSRVGGKGKNSCSCRECNPVCPTYRTNTWNSVNVSKDTEEENYGQIAGKNEVWRYSLLPIIMSIKRTSLWRLLIIDEPGQLSQYINYATDWTIRILFQAGIEIIFLRHRVHIGSEAPTSFLSNGYWRLFSRR